MAGRCRQMTPLDDDEDQPPQKKQRAPQKTQRVKPVIKIGSDCTGLNAARLAFEFLGLGLKVKEVFACEVSAVARKVIKHNFDMTDAKIYEDITERDHAAAPYVDFYSAGFPCQSYSRQGLGEGVSSTNGNVGLHCLMFIRNKRPKAFILENVASLASKRHWHDFSLIMNFIKGIKDKAGQSIYRLTWKIVNSLEHGVAQSRPRVFIVGLRQERRTKKFRWPVPKLLPSLEFFLDRGSSNNPPDVPTTVTEQGNYLACVKTIIDQGKTLTDHFIADLGGGFVGKSGGASHNLAYGYAPCLTKSRCSGNSYYCFARGRKLNLTELFRLQGMPARRIVAPPGVSDCQLRAMIGNSFSVPVFAAIAARALYAVGLTDEPTHFVYGTGDDGNAWPTL
jgi:site-specific DNA-cytosine methylase